MKLLKYITDIFLTALNIKVQKYNGTNYMGTYKQKYRYIQTVYNKNNSPLNSSLYSLNGNLKST